MIESTTPQPRIAAYYEDDHDRLDGIFKEFQRLKHNDFPQAKKFFKQFKIELQRHIVWEEEILFPLFEEKTGIASGGPTTMMRMEHRLIAQHLEAIHEKVRQADPNSDPEEQMLLNTLFEHNQKEEMILYPAIDRSLNDTERAGVFTSMANTPEERYHQCCHTTDHHHNNQ
jgi:regulator of cell morphogenesis and NO signaling